MSYFNAEDEQAKVCLSGTELAKSKAEILFILENKISSTDTLNLVVNIKVILLHSNSTRFKVNSKLN